MKKNNKIWVILAEVILWQWRAILNPFNYSYFKCNQQTNRHTFARITILGKDMFSCFNLEFIVVPRCYLSNKCWLNKSLITATIWVHVALLMLQYTQGMNELHLSTSRILFLLWSQGGCCQQCPWRHLVVLSRKLFGLVCPRQVRSLV